MSRAPRSAPVNDDPALPTRPRARSASGHELADDGLPLSGPARARALAERRGDATGATAPSDAPAPPEGTLPDDPTTD